MMATSLAYPSNKPLNGATYAGSPDLAVGANFIKAGGGPGSFSMVRAWDNMIGASALEEDLAELASIYGQEPTDRFVSIFNFAIADAWAHAGMDNVSIPQPTESSGRPLALAVLRAGTTQDGLFLDGYLLEHMLSPRVYSQVAGDINARYGPHAYDEFRRVGNEFLDLVATQVGSASVD